MESGNVDSRPAMEIPFNYPHITGKEIDYIKEVLDGRHLCGDGKYSRLCQGWLEKTTGCERALLTPSGTAALEMAALLLDVGPEDEVIMPSFTFVSTANAFALRGAKVVFVDIRPDTLNIDETEVAKALTDKTRVVVPVHYAGVGCEMHILKRFCDDENLALVEDAAHAILSEYDGKPLGTFGQLSAVSFHETKNLVAGEAGALIINDPAMVERAEIIREKGTNRSQFYRGQIDKYTWQGLGSSYLASELQAAFLWAQMEQAQYITDRRRASWECYHRKLEPLEMDGHLRRPIVPSRTMQNGHIYYILAGSREERDELMNFLISAGIGTVFHYVPLHDAPGAAEYSSAHGELKVTTDLSGRLLRLPLSVSLREDDIERIVSEITRFYSERTIRISLSSASQRVESSGAKK